MLRLGLKPDVMPVSLCFLVFMLGKDEWGWIGLVALCNAAVCWPMRRLGTLILDTSCLSYESCGGFLSVGGTFIF